MIMTHANQEHCSLMGIGSWADQSDPMPGVNTTEIDCLDRDVSAADPARLDRCNPFGSGNPQGHHTHSSLSQHVEAETKKAPHNMLVRYMGDIYLPGHKRIKTGPYVCQKHGDQKRPGVQMKKEKVARWKDTKTPTWRGNSIDNFDVVKIQ